MKRIISITTISLLTACTVPQDTPGSVYAFDDNSVTIRGAFQPGQTAAPNSTMVSQAKEVCPGATYISATPSPTDTWSFLYLFRC